MKIGVCITTYRENLLELGQLTGTLAQRGFLPFVVDAEETGVRRGIAPCLMQAWQQALDAGCDWVLQMDAGGSHSADDIPKLFEELADHDMVIGSRFVKGSKYIGNPKRALLSRLAAGLCNWAQPGAGYSDWTSGFRGFRAETVSRLLDCHYRGAMHEWQIEVLAHAGELGLRIREVPITYVAGRSSFNLKVAWAAFQVWLHILNHIPQARLEVEA